MTHSKPSLHIYITGPWAVENSYLELLDLQVYADQVQENIFHLGADVNVLMSCELKHFVRNSPNFKNW